ncbi:jg2780 [Pararge aegeria aegeria]|uniref:Jg2780 protein n=3 Tax=Pararge aegeria TaxID=116150 RepID=A0A8S4QPE5_9NEOP|nr:jg2780 [Pararge aegeria aegeria]
MQEQETEVIDETGAVFKKPTFNVSKTIKKLPEEQKKPIFESNRIIMPEYVVGMSKKKINKIQIKNKNIKDNGEVKKELKLNHLYELDCDDDNDDCT